MVNCFGVSSTGTGLNAKKSCTNCSGQSFGSGTGLSAAYSATGSYGYSTRGTGLAKASAANCYGTGVTGLTASGGALNCTGIGTTGAGIDCTGAAATNCKGASNSSYGIFCTTATGCVGTSTDGFGLLLHHRAELFRHGHQRHGLERPQRH